MINKVWAVVPAAGIGSRMQADRPKQYLLLNNKPVIFHTLQRLISHPLIEGVVIALSANDPYWPALNLPANWPIHSTLGGNERADSVSNALQYLQKLTDKDPWVLVHDAARPCIRHSDIDLMLHQLAEDAVGGILGVPLSETVKRVNADNIIEATVDRSGLWRALTPQMFRLNALSDALTQARQANINVTDEASAMEFIGLNPKMVGGHADNIKITLPQDLALAALFLQQQENGSRVRIGHGYDVHRFAENCSLVIGGVTIPHTHGLEAHSDGDVLIHAICDALLGAAGWWDIGHHFPDTDMAFAGIDSRVLLRRVYDDLTTAGWQVGNVDATVVAQVPKLAPFIPQMRELLASDLQIDSTEINIKATTTEKLGFAGRKEGIAAHAVALIKKVEPI